MKSVFGLFGFLLDAHINVRAQEKTFRITDAGPQMTKEEVSIIVQQLQQAKTHGELLQGLKKHWGVHQIIYNDLVKQMCTPLVMYNLRSEKVAPRNSKIQGNLRSLTKQIIFFSRKLLFGPGNEALRPTFERWCYIMTKRFEKPQLNSLKKHTKYLTQVCQELEKRFRREENSQHSTTILCDGLFFWEKEPLQNVVNVAKKHWMNLRTNSKTNDSHVILQWHVDYLSLFALNDDEVAMLSSRENQDSHRIAFIKILALHKTKKLKPHGSAQGLLHANITLISKRYHVLIIERETELIQCVLRRGYGRTIQELIGSWSSDVHRCKRLEERERFFELLSKIDEDLITECIVLHMIRMTYVDSMDKKDVSYYWHEIDDTDSRLTENIRCDLNTYVAFLLRRKNHSDGVDCDNVHYVTFLCYFLMKKWPRDRIRKYLNCLPTDIVNYLPKRFASLLQPRFAALYKLTIEEEADHNENSSIDLSISNDDIDPSNGVANTFGGAHIMDYRSAPVDNAQREVLNLDDLPRSTATIVMDSVDFHSSSASSKPQKLRLDSGDLWRSFQSSFDFLPINKIDNNITVTLYDLIDGVQVDQIGSDHGGITRHVMERLSQHIKNNISTSNILAQTSYGTYYLCEKKGAARHDVELELEELSNFLTFAIVSEQKNIVNMRFEKASLEIISDPDFLDIQLRLKDQHCLLPVFDEDTQKGLNAAAKELRQPQISSDAVCAHGLTRCQLSAYDELLAIALQQHRKRYLIPARSLARPLHHLVKRRVFFLNQRSLSFPFKKRPVPTAEEVIAMIDFSHCNRKLQDSHAIADKFKNAILGFQQDQIENFLSLMNGSASCVKKMIVRIEDNARWPQWQSCFNRMNISLEFSQEQLLQAMEQAKTMFSLA